MLLPRTKRRKKALKRSRRAALFEQLEQRMLLAAEVFELSSLLPAGGGDGSEGFAIRGTTGGEQLGHSVAAAEDVNRDGFQDVMVGAPGTLVVDQLAGSAHVSTPPAIVRAF